MAEFQSFDEQKRKLQKIWEQNQGNTSNITENIKTINVGFNSQTALKTFNIITLVDDELSSDGRFGHLQFDFPDFPDWAVNFAKPMIFMRFDPAWNVVDEKPLVFGESKLNDFVISSTSSFETWWTKVGNTWRFNIIGLATSQFVTDIKIFGLITERLPVYLTVKLYLINERNYNIIQSGK